MDGNNQCVDMMLRARTMVMRRGGPAAAVLCSAAILLAGCGGSNAANHQVAVVTTTTSTTPHAPVPLGRDKIKKITGKPVPAQGVKNGPQDESNATGAKPVNPCTLVTRAEAQAILGRPVATPVEAPQGPTCIYRPKGERNLITVAVESLAFSKVQPQSQLNDRVSLTIAGHAGYCGKAGAQQLVVPLKSGKFLAVVAPCPIAAAFAAKALSRYA